VVGFTHAARPTGALHHTFNPLQRQFNGVTALSTPVPLPQAPLTALSAACRRVRMGGASIRSDRGEAGRAPAGMVLTGEVQESGGARWHKVDVDGTTGWINETQSEAIEAVPRDGFAIPHAGAALKDSEGRTLHRFGAGDFIAAEQIVQRTSQDGVEWANVRVGGQTGWIEQRHLLPVERTFVTDADGRICMGPFDGRPANSMTCGVLFKAGDREYVALGHLDGITVWDWTALQRGEKAGVRAKVRGFYGHDAQVTCLGASPRGDWLVSGSMDGTICAWSLKDLGRSNELGVAVESQAGGAPVVRSVQPHSPGWEAGFEAGQRILAVNCGGQDLAKDQFARCLNECLPDCELYVTVRPAGGGAGELVLQTPVLRDPLWTLYPRHDGYWVLWTPDGYFDAREGDEFQLLRTDEGLPFEWHMSVVGVNAALGRQSAIITMPGDDY
ncbi:MAG: PDZ domain-containing protein, partial [Planctomycetaceae bacterium]